MIKKKFMRIFEDKDCFDICLECKRGIHEYSNTCLLLVTHNRAHTNALHVISESLALREKRESVDCLQLVETNDEVFACSNSQLMSPQLTRLQRYVCDAS